MGVLEELVRKHLPASVGVEWSGLSYQEKHVGGQTGLVLALAFLFVFLFLAAQYETTPTDAGKCFRTSSSSTPIACPEL